MTFATVQSVSGGANSAGTSHTVSLPTGIASGNLLVAIFASSSGSSGMTTTWPAGWTSLLHSFRSGSPNMWLDLAYRIADGTEGASLNVTTSQSVDGAFTTYCITGYSGTLEVGSVGQGGTSSANPPALAPSWGALDTLWIAVNGHAGSATATTTAYPASYTNGREDGVTPPSAGSLVATALRQLNASSEDPGAFTMDSTDVWEAVTIAIRPVVASGALQPRLQLVGCGA